VTGDDITLGGPDPFPEETDGGCPDTHGGYECTRASGHPLPHLSMAGVPGIVPFVAAVWPPYRRASVLDVLARVAPPESTHRPVEQIATDLTEAIRACQARNDERLKAVIRPYFQDKDWCCLFAFAGGLLSWSRQLFGPVPAGARLVLQIKAGASPAQRLWGQMLSAHLADDMPRCGELFREAMERELIGELMAYGVVSTAYLDRRAKAAAN
jgi:hypothetical protein